MSDSQAYVHNGTAAQSIRHSKEDALDEREFELLLEGATSLESPYDREARFVILVAGRLGLRLGELTHMRASWVDDRKRMVAVPRHQGCSKGRDGGLCGLCLQQARQQAARVDGLAVADVRPAMWRSKTDAAARSVPYGFSPRCEIAIERFFDAHDQWPYSHSVVRRRLEWAADAAVGLDADEIYPHALRSTCATHMAGKGLSGLELQGMMGWVCPSTSENYVAHSPENLSRALHRAHSR